MEILCPHKGSILALPIWPNVINAQVMSYNLYLYMGKIEVHFRMWSLPSRYGPHSCLRKWCGASRGGNKPCTQSAIQALEVRDGLIVKKTNKLHKCKERRKLVNCSNHKSQAVMHWKESLPQILRCLKVLQDSHQKSSTTFIIQIIQHGTIIWVTFIVKHNHLRVQITNYLYQQKNPNTNDNNNKD